MQENDHDANHEEHDGAREHDQVQTLSRVDEQLKTPVLDHCVPHKDDELRVRDNGSPHADCALAIHGASGVEVLDVVVTATDSEETVGQLERHVARLVGLSAHGHVFVVIKVGDNESVACADSVVPVEVVVLGEFGVNGQSLEEEAVGDDVVVQDHNLGLAVRGLLQQQVESAVLIDINKCHELAGFASCLREIHIVRVLFLVHKNARVDLL